VLPGASPQVEAAYAQIDADRSGSFDYIEWLDCIEPLRVRGVARVVTCARCLLD
jgi:hypothetical protein